MARCYLFLSHSSGSIGLVSFLISKWKLPLAAPITASASTSEMARAPWFFLWVQQMLKLGNPFFWGGIVPLAVLVLISFIPYFFPQPAKGELGHWFPKGNRLAQAVALFILIAIIALTILALLPAA